MSEYDQNAVAVEVPEEFEYVNLSEIDPNSKPVPDGFYTTQIQNVKVVDYIAKSGKNIGKAGRRYDFRVQVLSDGPARGRVVFDTLFHGEGTLRAFRRIMDASGVPQDPGEPMSEYVARLAAAKPELKFKIVAKEEVDNRTGEKVARNRVDFYSATVAE